MRETMTHEDALNYMLASSCGKPSSEGEGWIDWVFEIHCATYTVVAKCVNYEEAITKDDVQFKYEIKCVKFGFGKK
jgi:hypothetical protein